MGIVIRYRGERHLQMVHVQTNFKLTWNARKFAKNKSFIPFLKRYCVHKMLFKTVFIYARMASIGVIFTYDKCSVYTFLYQIYFNCNYRMLLIDPIILPFSIHTFPVFIQILNYINTKYRHLLTKTKILTSESEIQQRVLFQLQTLPSLEKKGYGL